MTVDLTKIGKRKLSRPSSVRPWPTPELGNIYSLRFPFSVAIER
jgi:hypothetical protein